MVPCEPRNGAEDHSRTTSYAPFRGLARRDLLPTACAVGYSLTPLRGLARTKCWSMHSTLMSYTHSGWTGGETAGVTGYRAGGY
jgi:hypothetical protein